MVIKHQHFKCRLVIDTILYEGCSNANECKWFEKCENGFCTERTPPSTQTTTPKSGNGNDNKVRFVILGMLI